MKFLLKLFKALNSAQSPWQVTLAIVLGMVAGLTPLEGIQTPLILLLAFVLNIHLGLFFVASAFFAGIAYLFDPLLEQVGFALLSSGALEGLWTSWYNSGVMRMTHFNNTLVAGSTAAALVLAFPIYFVLGWVIAKYREKIAVFLNARPWLGKIGIFKVPAKKEPFLRWWGAGVFVAAVALVAAVTLLLVDPLLKWALENGASGLLQRDVRIGSVNTRIGEGAVDIQRIEIAGEEEGVDALSMERMRFDIALGALLLNRTHIEKVAVNGMGFGTEATLKKAAARPEGAEEAKGAERGTFEMPALELPDPASLVEKADLKSVKVYEEAKAEIDAIGSKWEKVAEEEFSADALKGLQKEFETIKAHAASKDPQTLLKLKDEITAFTKKVEERKNRLQKLQQEFDADQRRIEALYAKVKKAPTDDYNRLKSAYTLDSSGAMNVIGTLFGEKIKGYLATAKKYYALLSPYLKSDKVPEEAVPARGEGRWIRYARTVPVPELWIAETEIDGFLKGQSFAASINDISDDQKALGRALTFALESDGEQVSGLKISGEDNRLGKRVKDTLAFSAERIRNEAMSLSSLQLSPGEMALKGDVELTDASALGGKAKIGFSNTAMAMEGLEGELGKAFNDALKGASSFDVGVGIAGSLEEPKLTVESDLDKKLASAAKNAMQGKIEGYRKELRALLDARMNDQLGSLRGAAGTIPNIDALAGEQTGALNGLGSQAGGLLGSSGGGAVKGLLPF